MSKPKWEEVVAEMDIGDGTTLLLTETQGFGIMMKVDADWMLMGSVHWQEIDQQTTPEQVETLFNIRLAMMEKEIQRQTLRTEVLQ